MAAFTSACAASFTGELYAYWYDDEEYCGLYRVEESWKNTTTWRSDFVEVDGVKEPALFGFDCYAFPVTVSPGEEFSASIVHGTSTDAHIKSVKVLTDAEMYAMFRNSVETGEWVQWKSELWSGGTKETRAWVVVEQNNVTSGPVYTLDLAGIRIVDRATGGLSSTTLGEYAKRYGSRVSGTVGLTQSVYYQVAISDCCSSETFPQRVWNVCDPFWQDYDPLEEIDEHGGDEELYDAPGLYFVTAEMLGRSSAGGIPGEWKKARTLNGVYDDECFVDGVCQLKCGKANKKGIAKVSLTITPFVGKKRTYKSVSVDVSKGGAVEVKWPKQSYTVTINGNEFFGEPVYGETRPACSPKSVRSATVGGKWTRTDSAVGIDYFYDGEFPKGTCEELLPYHEPIRLKAGRWSFAKAAMVKLSKDRTSVSVDTSKGRSNTSAMRLTYTPKTGIYKGTFKLYALIDAPKGKKQLKKHTVKVMGAVVEGYGYGVGSLKSYGTPFMIQVGEFDEE